MKTKEQFKGALCYVGACLLSGDTKRHWLDCHPTAAESIIGMRISGHIRVFATHNPYIVDFFPADCVIVQAQASSGVFHESVLSQHPDWERVQGGLSTGEFWSSVGEKWVLPGETSTLSSSDDEK